MLREAGKGSRQIDGNLVDLVPLPDGGFTVDDGESTANTDAATGPLGGDEIGADEHRQLVFLDASTMA
jgi:hypothetical protein